MASENQSRIGKGANLDVSVEDLQGPRIDRRTALKLLGASGLTGLAGCLGGDDDDDAGTDDDDVSIDGDEIYGGHFTVATLQDGTEYLEPGYTTSTQIGQVIHQASNGLLTLTEDVEIVGDIAEDWHTEDGQTYTFELRDDVVFHTGKELTAQDFVNTFERGMDHGGAVLIQRDLGDRLQAPPEGLVAVDDHTLEVNFSRQMAPGPVFLLRSARALVPTDHDALEEMDEEDFMNAPPMTGAFEIVEHDPDASVELERFDDYWKEDDEGRQLPYLDGITWEFIPEESTIASGLRTGEVDITDSSITDHLPSLEEEPDLEVSAVPDIQMRMITINQDRPDRDPDHQAVFQDVRFREALSRAVPRQEWIDEQVGGHGVPMYGMYSPALGDLYREPEERFSDPVEIEGDAYTDPDEDKHAYDPDRAMELLEEVDEDIGIPDDFEVEWLSWPGREDDGIRLGIYLREIGLDYTTNIVPTAQYFELSGNSEFDFTPLGSYGDLDPETYLQTMFHPDPDIGDWNDEMLNYRNERIGELLDEQQQEANEDERRELLWEIEDILNEDVPAMWIKHLDNIVTVRTNINNWSQHVSHVWFEESYLD